MPERRGARASRLLSNAKRPEPSSRDRCRISRVRLLSDHQGRAIRLTEERRNHILRHMEMVGLDEDIERAVATPDSVVESVSDTETRPYYRYLAQTLVGPKVLVRGGQDSAWRCVRHHGVLDRQRKERACVMADRRLRIWYDREGDFLEVIFEDRAGVLPRDTERSSHGEGGRRGTRHRLLNHEGELAAIRTT